MDVLYYFKENTMINGVPATLKCVVVAVFSGINMNMKDAAIKWTPWTEGDPGMAEASNNLAIWRKVDMVMIVGKLIKRSLVPKTDI